MSVKEQTCYRLVCDGCDSVTSEEDWHWPTASEARGTAGDDNWLLNYDGKDYCYSCRRKLEHDHKWDDGVCDICEAFEPDVSE